MCFFQSSPNEVNSIISTVHACWIIDDQGLIWTFARKENATLLLLQCWIGLYINYIPKSLFLWFMYTFFCRKWKCKQNYGKNSIFERCHGINKKKDKKPTMYTFLVHCLNFLTLQDVAVENVSMLFHKLQINTWKLPLSTNEPRNIL